jgi:hypothetical protein
VQTKLVDSVGIDAKFEQLISLSVKITTVDSRRVDEVIIAGG